MVEGLIGFDTIAGVGVLEDSDGTPPKNRSYRLETVPCAWGGVWFLGMDYWQVVGGIEFYHKALDFEYIPSVGISIAMI